MAEAVENRSDTTASVPTQSDITPKVDGSQKENSATDPSQKDSTAIVSMDVETISSDTCKKNSSEKKEYTEAEKLKRKEFFSRLKETRKAARERHRRNFLKNPSNRRSFTRAGQTQSSRNILARNMSDEDKKMLDFYKVRLSTLRSENESLHQRLSYLVKENMRFLQMGPPKTSSF